MAAKQYNYEVVDDMLHLDQNRHIVLMSKKTQKKYVVVKTSNQDQIVMSEEDLDTIHTQLYYSSIGYFYVNKKLSLHQHIMNHSENKNMTIDHINWEKKDNRRENLRFASMSEQNSNRKTRGDKIEPPIEIKNLGIKRLPRYMRWDLTEYKFRVEFPEKTISGTKSCKVSMINKFRDAVEKILEHGIEDDELVVQRHKLAQEYNEIMEVAHLYNPDEFSDELYCDTDELIGEKAFCLECLQKLPVIEEHEILHGPRSVAQNTVTADNPQVYIIEKNGTKVFFDQKFKDKIDTLPAIDLSSKSPVVPCTGPFLQKYPKFKNEKKLAIKEFIFIECMKQTIPDGYCVIPLNYQQTDMRSENLILAPGLGIHYKSANNIPYIPPESKIEMKFWPRNITSHITTTPASKASPYVIQLKYKDKNKALKKISCSLSTMKARFENELLPILRSEYENFDEENEKYQKLLDEYVSMQ